MRRWLREPLLHFLVLGAALFAVYALVRPSRSDSSEIVVSAGRVAAIEAQFRGVWQRPPTEAELAALVDTYVREEVLYREGVARGFDLDDPVIRNRVRQKVEFLAEDTFSAEPTDADLAAYLAQHREQFEIPAAVSFEQVFFDPARRGAGLDRDVAEALAALGRGAAAAGLGDRTILPGRMEHALPPDVSSTFGREFSANLDGVPVGVWHGPVRSTYGTHLVRVIERGTPTMPSLADARHVVAREWTRARTVEMRERFYQSLRSQFTVTIESASDANARAGDR
ncbi:MAG TPA: peptidylprolyl isomerase [Vicinamibacteria bacterium]|nr:peptidylprolyl isomerase [Vicinamibacteria bacterium]